MSYTTYIDRTCGDGRECSVPSHLVVKTTKAEAIVEAWQALGTLNLSVLRTYGDETTDVTQDDIDVVIRELEDGTRCIGCGTADKGSIGFSELGECDDCRIAEDI